MNDEIPKALNKLISCLPEHRTKMSIIDEEIKKLESLLQELQCDSFEIEIPTGEKIIWESRQSIEPWKNTLMCSYGDAFGCFIGATRTLKEILFPFIPQFIEKFMKKNNLEETKTTGETK